MKKIKPQQLVKEKVRSESAIQFEAIYEKHHDSFEIEKRKLMRNREERAYLQKLDNGLI